MVLFPDCAVSGFQRAYDLLLLFRQKGCGTICKAIGGQSRRWSNPRLILILTSHLDISRQMSFSAC